MRSPWSRVPKKLGLGIDELLIPNISDIRSMSSVFSLPLFVVLCDLIIS
jgi:hypothetical protein